jgi:ribosomal protein S6--L-glutamate ligase
MKIGILSRNPSLYSTRRLAQAARMRGHHVKILDTLSMPVQVGLNPVSSLDLSIPELDAIVPRIGPTITFYGLAVVRQFESTGVITTASSEAIARSRDKLHSLQVMSRSGLPTPNSTIVSSPNDIWSAIEIAGGLPVIIKVISGTQGRGVFLATAMHTVQSILRSIRSTQEQIIIQEFIKESKGTDIRVIVVENRCVAAMRRQASAGEFRSNLHRGGTATPVELDEHTRDLARKAAQVHGLGFAGVDLVQSKRGPLVLEVNSSPGLEGIEKTTQVDIAAEVMLYLEREERKKQHKHRIKKSQRKKVSRV